MNFFVFLLTSFIAYLGITIGQYLIFIAPEELVPGRKYFKQWFYLLFSATLFSVLFFYPINLYIVLAISFLVYLVLFFFYEKFHFSKYLVFLILGTLVGLSSKKVDYFMLTSSLVLLTAMPFGSLSIKHYKKKDRFRFIGKELVANLSYFIFAIILFFI